MARKRRHVLFREMMFDLYRRLRLADDLFCAAAESLVSAAALEDWSSRSEALRNIRAYSLALRIIHQDLSRIGEEKHAVFPAELGDWIFQLPEGELAAQLHLERLRGIAGGMEMLLDRKLLETEAAL